MLLRGPSAQNGNVIIGPSDGRRLAEATSKPYARIYRSERRRCVLSRSSPALAAILAAPQASPQPPPRSSRRAAAAAGQQPPASRRQQPERAQQPPIRTGINFVRVDVIVTDRQGQAGRST